MLTPWGGIFTSTARPSEKELKTTKAATIVEMRENQTSQVVIVEFWRKEAALRLVEINLCDLNHVLLSQERSVERRIRGLYNVNAESLLHCICLHLLYKCNFLHINKAMRFLLQRKY